MTPLPIFWPRHIWCVDYGLMHGYGGFWSSGFSDPWHLILTTVSDLPPCGRYAILQVPWACTLHPIVFVNFAGSFAFWLSSFGCLMIGYRKTQWFVMRFPMKIAILRAYPIFQQHLHWKTLVPVHHYVFGPWTAQNGRPMILVLPQLPGAPTSSIQRNYATKRRNVMTNDLLAATYTYNGL